MKYYITFCCLLFSLFQASAQDNALGLRFGNPSGFTYKSYQGSDKAIELGFGRSYPYRSINHRGYFYDWRDRQNYDYVDYRNVRDYRSTVPLNIFARYLLQQNIADVKGLQWYYGAGLQLRWQRYIYRYDYRRPNDPRWYEGEDSFTSIDLGVDAVIGLEYKFEKEPISLFLDATVFVEVYDRFFNFWPQSGIGARYHF